MQCVVKSAIQDILNATSYFFLWKMTFEIELQLLYFSISKKKKSKQLFLLTFHFI